MSGASDRLFLIVHGVAVPAPFLGGGSPPPLTPPGQPVGLSATPGVTTMTLAWSPPATGGATGYRVTRDGSVVATPAGSPWTDTALTASSSHTWTVHATGPGGVSATGASVTRSTLATPPVPTAANTGPTPGLTLTSHTGDYVVSADGAVVSGLHITGHLYIAASDVLVVDCWVDGDVAINATPGGGQANTKARQVLRRVKARAVANPGGFDTLTFDACRFGGFTGTFMQLVDSASRTASNLALVNCLFDGMGAYAGTTAHYEAVHLFGISSALIENNVFDYVAPDAYTRGYITGCFVFEDSFNSGRHCTDITFRKNVLRGGGYYQMYNGSVRGSSSFDNNAFNSYTGMAGVQYPPVTGTAYTQSGNTLDGAPFALAAV